MLVYTNPSWIQSFRIFGSLKKKLLSIMCNCYPPTEPNHKNGSVAQKRAKHSLLDFAEMPQQAMSIVVTLGVTAGIFPTTLSTNRSCSTKQRLYSIVTEGPVRGRNNAQGGFTDRNYQWKYEGFFFNK